MEFGIHLPLIEFAGEGFSLPRLTAAVDAAREAGFSTVAANDHLVFSAPWLDGLTALAAVLDRSGDMTLTTSVSLASLRGPVPLAKALAALDLLCGGRVIAGVGPGSSKLDYELAGISFDDRWRRLDASIDQLRSLLQPDAAARSGDAPQLEPFPRQVGGIPIWVGSWGSPAGLRRVARLGDGWLGSAYHTTPTDFDEHLTRLQTELEARGRPAERFPNAVATMWTHVTDKQSAAEGVLVDVLGPLLKQDPTDLGTRLCIGSPSQCADLLSRFAEAGCQRVYFWPVGDERQQIERLAIDVLPLVAH